MELKRLTLALILCTLFVIGYMALVSTTREPIEDPDPGGSETERTEPGSGETPPGSPDDAGTPEPDADSAESDAEAVGEIAESTPGDEAFREVGEAKTRRVETDRFIVDFTSKGAVPMRVLSKELTRESGLDPTMEENLVAIIDTFEEGRSPLLWSMPSSRLDLASLDWIVSEPVRSGGVTTVAFEIAPGNKLKFRKKFILEDGRDDIRVEIEVITMDASVENRTETFQMTGATGIVFEGDPTRTSADMTFGLVKSVGGSKIRTLALKDVQKAGGSQTIASDVEWTAVVSKYFAAILLAENAPGRVQQVVFDTVRSPDLYEALRTKGGLPQETIEERAKSKLATRLEYFTSVAVAGQSIRFDFQMYLGLKSPEVLGKEPYRVFKPVLEHTGMPTCGMGGIVKPIAWVLRKFLNGIYAVVGNYGIAIILLTLLVKLAMFPVTRHQQVTMAAYQSKMQKHKPELDKLREKYKNNRQRLNQETLKFFKEKGINPFPLGGCLPLLATLPVFLGLFYLLRTATELRQANFMGWINDLSRPDQLIPDWPELNLLCISIHGLNLLPILMTVAWFLQQRSMPKPADPQQAQTQQMMLFMPIVFGFMLYDFAAGLSLYWLTNSLIGLVEQKIIRRNLPKPEPVPAK